MGYRYFYFILCLAMMFLGQCSKKQKATNFEERYTVKKINLKDQISQTGSVQPLVKVELKSEASGKIERIFVKEGQKVSRGDTILIIDPTRLLIQQQKLDLNIKKAQIDKLIAKRDYTNGLEIMQSGGLSEKKLQDLELAVQIAAIEYEQQELELKDILDQLKYTIIRAPKSGVITSLLVKEGEIAVSATSGFQSGTAIGTIADISNLEVITTIGEVDYVRLSQGQSVTIKPEALEGLQTQGTISFISLSAKKDANDELSGFEVRITIDSLIPGIAPGINVNVEFIILEKKNVLAVPTHFVSKLDTLATVTRITTNKEKKESFEIIPVTTGATDYRYFEILTGLSEGDILLFKPEAEKTDK